MSNEHNDKIADDFPFRGVVEVVSDNTWQYRGCLLRSVEAVVGLPAFESNAVQDELFQRLEVSVQPLLDGERVHSACDNPVCCQGVGLELDATDDYTVQLPEKTGFCHFSLSRLVDRPRPQ